MVMNGIEDHTSRALQSCRVETNKQTNIERKQKQTISIFLPYHENCIYVVNNIAKLYFYLLTMELDRMEWNGIITYIIH